MTIGATKFSCYVDDWVYKEYSAMKAKAIIENRKQYVDSLKKAEKMGYDVSKDFIDVEAVSDVGF